MRALFVLFLLATSYACVFCHHHHGHDHHLHKHEHRHDEQEAGGEPVTVSLSGEFRGGFNVTRGGRRFESYRGIRYAEPPVGELRFQPPVLITKYKTPVDAREDGPSCPRPASPGYFVDEDCLTINVYTPLKKDRSKPFPVIFFIHAGGFYTMSGRSDLAGPHYLLDRDIVFVTINYRLGSLGFLSTGDALAPGNNGFKDQVAALHWVQNNIAAFGGDPASVTIAGCSAGSSSVMLHMVSPMTKGLFHKGISMSGSRVAKAPLADNMYDLAVKQAQLLSCPTDNSTVIIDCLNTKHWRDLGNSLLGFYEFGFDPVGIWNPIVEKDFGQERYLDIQPADAIREGKIHAVPYIVSQTEDEFFWKAFYPLRNQTLRDRMNAEWETVAPISFQLPRENKTYAAYAARRLRTQYLHDKPLANDKESARNLGLLYADSIESFPVHRLANLMNRHSPHPVWYYEFSYIGNHSHYKDPVTKKPVAAAHHDDLIYLFTLSYRFPDITGGLDLIASERLTALWYNFARYGWGWLEYKLAIHWWREPDMGVSGERDGCAASRMWRSACGSLVAPAAEEAWQQIVDASPSDAVWHSLRNCVAYQAGVWQNLLLKGTIDVLHPAAFKMAVVLRHTPSELSARMLADLLHLHPQSQDLTAYVLALLTDDEAWCGTCGSSSGISDVSVAAAGVPGGAPVRDLQLFGDCELAVLAASREEYEAHAKLVRAEYATLTQKSYVELRLKVLNQLSQIPKLYHTPEFESFEPVARENIDREITTLREHLLTGQHE